MKQILLTLVCLMVLPIALFAEEAAENQTGTLIVKTVGLKSDQGEVRLALCNCEENYSSKDAEPFRRIAVPISEKQAEAVFEDLPFGEYAIKLFHDKNSNGDLDTNFLGLPKEDYAFSNNAKATFGPPEYEKAKFEFKEDMSIEIRMSSPEE
jgi:uncharacterized protein (DUF2141 family)